VTKNFILFKYYYSKCHKTYKDRLLKTTMGTALITIKIMPESPDTELEAIKEKARETIAKGQGKVDGTKEEPIAFGLKAIIVNFALDESKELEPIENELKKIEGVSSVQVIDMRRAFG
jgi:elongation factor 1-beta